MSDSDNLTRICTKCKREFPATLEYFHKHKLGKNGLRSTCKGCSTAASRAWSAANPERRRENQNRWNRENPERVKAKRLRHKSKHNAYSRAYDAAHREQKRAKDKARYWSDPDFHRERHRQWRQSNPEQNRVRNHRYCARKLKAEGSYTKGDIELLYKNQKGKCWWCGKKLVKGKTHIDHRIPITKGGSNNPSNLVLACEFCNCSKHDNMPWEWIGRLL